MNADTYATALYQVLDGVEHHTHDQLLKRFVDVVKSRRHERLFPAIVRAFERKIMRAQQGHVAHITFAHATDANDVDGLLQKDLRELGAQDASRIMTQDSTLIGGYVITARGQRVDASYKRALVEMYHSLIRS